MDTKDILIICLSIILAALIIVGAIFFIGDNDGGDVVNNTNQDNSSVLVSQVADKDSQDNDIVSEEIKFNYQAGSGYYKEIHYKDGGFRQYDADTGELIGSSYESDQKYLPSME